MASRRILKALIALAVSVCLTNSALAQDPRESLGTKSTAAAKLFADGHSLMEQKKPDDALPLFEKAAKEDPDFELAYYWQALALTDLGDVDAAIARYEKLLAVAERTNKTNIAVDACVNAGLALAKAKETKQATVWFTRAITLDPEDKNDLRWKAFRNMAIACHEREDHLSAALCAMAAYVANPRRVDAKMVVDLLDQVNKEEIARVLDFGQTVPKVVDRGRASELGEAATVPGLEAVSVQALLVDPAGQRLLAMSFNQPKYFVIDCQNKQAVREIKAPGSVLAASLVGSRLFLSIQGTGLVETEIATGKSLKTWTIASAAPASVAVFPAQGVAMFAADDLLQALDLDTGKVTPSAYPAQAVAADPRQEFCYAFLRREPSPGFGELMIDGRPVIIERSDVDWRQTLLTKYAVVDKRPLPAELRLNAASNGRQLYISPDGDWLAVVGGGGWRPSQAQSQKTGYGVAVMSAADLGHVQGFFATDAYPIGMAINPVTHQVVAIREADAKVYHLSQPEQAVTLPGPHTAAAAWSPDGKYLYIASKTGVRVWKNALDAAEEKLGVTWTAAITTPANHKSAATARTTAEPLVEYAKFQVKNERPAAEGAIREALAKGRRLKPQEWLTYEPYLADPKLRDTFREFSGQFDEKDAGIRIYRLKKLKTANPTHPGIEFQWGMALYVAGQLNPAIEHHLQAIHLDQARTNITLESLRCLGQIYKRQEKPLAAAFCYAHVLRLDLDNPTWRAEAEPMFEHAGLKEAAKDLLAGAGGAGAVSKQPALAANIALPPLPVNRDKTVYSASKLFEKCAASVVMVRSEDGSGSGVCIADGGFIITNHHVVGDRQDELKVHTYQTAAGKTVRSEPLAAEVLFRSEADDLALIRVKKGPKSLRPLPLAAAAPAAGDKVFAIGNPGLGKTILDQSISEGIVSSPTREFNGKTFLQHTAAVNPGNSGGALLDEHGRLIGIVTWKTGLENVSFAIPADQVRTVYESLRTAKPKKP